MSSVIILKDGYMPPVEAFSEKGKTYILTTENEQVPVSLLGVAKGSFELTFAGEGSEVEYAFALGKIIGAEKTVKVYSSDDALLGLVNKNELVKAPKRKRTSEKKGPVKENITEDETFPMNKPESEPEKEKSPEKPEHKERKRRAPKSKEGKSLSKVTEDEIKKLLKKNGYDEKYVSPIMEALKTSENKLTVDLFVRTKVSMMEKEQKIITALGDLIKEEYGQ